MQVTDAMIDAFGRGYWEDWPTFDQRLRARIDGRIRRGLELVLSENQQPVGYVNRARVERREDPLPILHYTATAHFDTPIYFHALHYRPPATGIAGTEDSVSIPFVADCLRRYAEILRNGLIDGAGHYFPTDIDEAADMLEASADISPDTICVPIEPDDSMLEAGEEEITSRRSVGARIYAADIWSAMIKSCCDFDSQAEPGQ